MNFRFSIVGIIAALVFGISIFFIACDDGMNDVVRYTGQVVYINTTTPFPDLLVKVTDGQNTHCQTQTDAGGNFMFKVRVNEIDGSYYLLAGDSTCIPKKVQLGGYGQAEVDLGVIEVEGPTLPTVTTRPITSVTADGAVCGGEVLTDGRQYVTARGVCYGTEQQPTIAGAHTTDGAGKGEFATHLQNLEHNTIYYARAYATNKSGTAYGEQVKFTTEEGVPLVVTDSVYRITAHSARCKGHVESDGGYLVTQKGTCWSKQPDPTIDDDCTNDGSGLGEFTSVLSNLVENTTYYIRTYATNSTATVYGNQITVITNTDLPIVATGTIENIRATSAICGGTIEPNGYIVTSCGLCWSSTTTTPTIEGNHTNDIVNKTFTSKITNLMRNTTYYCRAYATNENGVSYGETITFTTSTGLATITTLDISSYTETSAITGGKITDDGDFSILERGVCWSLQPEPTIFDFRTSEGSGIGSFTSTISDIDITNKNNTYYIRAYATNEAGTAYGNEVIISYQYFEYEKLPRIEYDGYIYVLYYYIGEMNWELAYQTCEDFNYAGFDDWELPILPVLEYAIKKYDNYYCIDQDGNLLDVQTVEDGEWKGMKYFYGHDVGYWAVDYCNGDRSNWHKVVAFNAWESGGYNYYRPESPTYDFCNPVSYKNGVMPVRRYKKF